MSTFTNLYVCKCCSRALLRGGSSARRLGDGAGSRPIRIGRSCTTCVAPVQNGERSMHTAQGAQARSRSQAQSSAVNRKAETQIETSHAYGLHPRTLPIWLAPSWP